MGDAIRIYQNDLMPLEKQTAELRLKSKKGSERERLLLKSYHNLEVRLTNLMLICQTHFRD